jgi:16S rRNA (adenine1518-N6/adenine1519-N6)-dimethyltransferase
MTRIEAKKSFGQNFLVDRGIITRILDAARLEETDSILEVGPGMGALTTEMLPRVQRLVAVELDRRMVEHLGNTLGHIENLEIMAADILKVDLAAELPARHPGSWKVVANLPYNISSQVLFRFLEQRQLFSLLLLMLQKEVGDRLVAHPGTKDYGILSVMFQVYFDIRREILVRPGAFRPVPKVDSAVLSFRPLPTPRVPVPDHELFRSVVRASFSQRRKTLRNCLRGIATLAEPELLRCLDAAGIDPGRRGETLSLQEFADLSREIAAGRRQ